MNWIKANTFLAAFFAVMIVGVGALGFLLVSAKSRHADATAQYEERASDLNRLQRLAPYPDAKNLAALQAQRSEHQTAILALQKSLGANEIPLEPLSDVQFQDRLREAVSRVVAKAAERGMKLPDKFYMGFDPYQTEPPRTEAAPLLGRQLKGIELVLNLMIESRVLALNKLEREPLPEEKSGAKTAERGGRGEKAAKPLVTAHPFDVNFTGEQNAVRAVLDAVVASKAQFFIPRLIEVKNEKEQGPPRIDPLAMAAAASAGFAPPLATPGAPPPPASPASLPGAAPAAGGSTLKYIVGEEKIEVAVRLEMIDFAEVASK